MKKTNTTRKMSPKEIEKAFNEIMLEKDGELLIDFIEMYPHFTEIYVDILLKKLSIINRIVNQLRIND